MKHLFCLLLLCLALPTQAALSLIALDVGEGQALLIKQEDRGILIDTGHPGMARHVLDRLQNLGIKHLDYLILTHLHPDHAGGYFRLREAFPETPVLYSGHPLPKDVRPDLTRWVNEALLHDPHRRTIGAGKTFIWQGITLTFLWPEHFTGNNLNRHSLVLLLEAKGRQILVMGDADKKVEQALLMSKHLPSRIDVLVVGHHGAADASSPAFIDRIHPLQAIISVNRNNIRGYPSAEVIRRMENAGIKVLRTDLLGEIRIDF